MTTPAIDSQPQQPSTWRRLGPLLLALGAIAVSATVAAVTYAMPALGDPIQNGLTAAALLASLRPTRVVVIQGGGAAGAGPA